MQEIDGLSSGKDIQRQKRRLNPIERKTIAKNRERDLSADQIGDFCERGYTLHEIADALDSPVMNVARVIEREIRKGKDYDTTHLIPPEMFSSIRDAFFTINSTSIKKVYAFLDGSASMAQIRIVRLMLQSHGGEQF
ncbi:MAG: helix-turn-helix domain-containing protein [Fibrobacterota bacterium]